jgi:hypothetical protein
MMACKSSRIRGAYVTLAALLPVLGCSSASNSSGPGGACAALQNCCKEISNSTTQSACMTELNSDQGLADSDTTCAASMTDFVSFCGADGGMPESGKQDHGSGGEGGNDAAAGPSLGFVPSNVDLQGIDTNNLPDVDIQTTACTIDSGDNGISCYDGPTIPQKQITQDANNVTINVYYVHSFKVEPNAVLKGTGSNALAIISLTTIDIEGQFLANANGSTAGVGGYGRQAGTGQGQAPSDKTSGSSGAGYCGTGGNGGSYTSMAVLGGNSWGTPEIVPLAGGSGAGGGGGCDDGAGAGGGALQLVAKASITVTAGALINAGGGGGAAAVVNSESTGGGGSGGSLLFEAPAVTIAGILAANGGGGGSESMAGGNATPDSTPAPGGTSSFAAGGSGSGGTTLSGGPGANGSPPSGFSGGGGGAAGRIRINTSGGSASVNGTISPSLGTSCTTQGVLRH